MKKNKNVMNFVEFQMIPKTLSMNGETPENQIKIN